jgi:UDP-2,3-diacylglucosamine pyrophosphatase LpxH
MGFIFVIISDLHILNESDFIFARKEKTINALRNKCIGAQHLFIIVPGDIAFSGTVEQYDYAQKYFSELSSYLKEYCKTDVTVLFTPGNHDCDFRKPNSIRDVLIKNVIDNPKENVSNEIIEVCCSVQDNYYSFISKFQDEKCTFEHQNLLDIVSIELEDVKFKIFLYNVSWLSQKDEKYGELLFPLQNLNKELFSTKNEIPISVLHHPFNWQTKDNIHEFKNHILQTSSIVITGHEHYSDSAKICSSKIGETIIIESGVFQDSKNKDESEFAILNVDVINKKLISINMKYENSEYKVNSEESHEYNYDKKATSNFLSLKKEYRELLNDPGANFSHPRKDSLVLGDFYLDPNFQEIEYKSILEKIEKKRNIYNSNVITQKDAPKIVILGTEKSGKTSFLRMRFIQYYNLGLIPILIEGKAFTSNSFDEVKKVIIKQCATQYETSKIVIESELDLSKVVLMVDDFETTNANKDYRNRLLATLDKYFKFIYITTNDLFFFEEKLLSSSDNIHFRNFRFYQIIRFGNLLRRNLIKKWISIGTIYSSSFEEQKAISFFSDALNRIIGKNLVPSTPFYLLTIIQSLEAGRPSDLQHSSYGYCYDYLITKSLSYANIPAKEIDEFYNVLSCLAYYLFSQKKSEIIESELRVFYSDHQEKYDVKTEFSYIVEKMLQSRILSNNNDVYHFKYKYLFYYFVAKYISLNISEEIIKENITEITKRINREENSNILMFLMHMSRDSFIIEKILEAAKLDFCKNEEVELDEDISIINSLLEEIPERVLEQLDSTTVNEERLKELDKLSGEDVNSAEVDPDGEIQYASEEKEDLLELSTQLNTSFKTIELLGQIIKCYYGSLRAETKLEIADEAFSITLRTLNCYFSLLKENLESILEELVEYFGTKKITDKEKILKQSRAFVFHLALIIAFSFMKRTSYSIGSEDLELTYDRILEKKGSTARQMLSMAIKLQHSHNIPEGDIIALDKYTKKKNLPNLLLKDLVLDFIYMFDVPLPVRQRICEKIGITYKIKKALDYKDKK